MISKLENKLIILSLAIFLIASFFFLAFIEQRQQNPDHQKNWWVVYFADAKNNSLNFAIENHGADANFHWSAASEKDKPFKEGAVEIKKGESREIVVDIAEKDDKKITIKVSDGAKAKEIYKDFRK